MANEFKLKVGLLFHPRMPIFLPIFRYFYDNVLQVLLYKLLLESCKSWPSFDKSMAGRVTK